MAFIYISSMYLPLPFRLPFIWVSAPDVWNYLFPTSLIHSLLLSSGFIHSHSVKHIWIVHFYQLFSGWYFIWTLCMALILNRWGTRFLYHTQLHALWLEHEFDFRTADLKTPQNNHPASSWLLKTCLNSYSILHPYLVLSSIVKTSTVI